MLILEDSCSFQWCTSFPCKSNIMYREIEKDVHGNCACIPTEFSAHKTQPTGKQSAPFEKA
jgi:hypothetical protein